jgi:N-acetylneuraminic acid mutarotase
VLVTGGQNASSEGLASAELYNLTTETWTATGSMTVNRNVDTATLMPNREVLVAGGYNAGRDLASAELYNLATGSFTPTGSMATRRLDHTAMLLQNGEVLVAGGENSTAFELSGAELYNLATGRWTATGSMASARIGHQAMLLPNGDVFVVGAEGIAGRYHPANGSWSAAGTTGNRSRFSATVLPNSEVLVAGGIVYPHTHSVATATLYNPVTNTWQGTGAMNIALADQTATLLQGGQVLVAGGNKIGPGAMGLVSAELYQP